MKKIEVYECEYCQERFANPLSCGSHEEACPKKTKGIRKVYKMFTKLPLMVRGNILMGNLFEVGALDGEYIATMRNMNVTENDPPLAWGKGATPEDAINELNTNLLKKIKT